MGDKPLHHKQEIPNQEYCFRCKHCSLQKVKSTNIYVPVYPYPQGMLFHIRKYVKYLSSNRNTKVYPLKSIWCWNQSVCTSSVTSWRNSSTQLKVLTETKGKDCKRSCWSLANFSITCQRITSYFMSCDQSLLHQPPPFPILQAPEAAHKQPLLRWHSCWWNTIFTAYHSFFQRVKVKFLAKCPQT